MSQYILQGYAINEKRLQALEKTVDIQTRMLAGALNIEERDVLRTVNEYTGALFHRGVVFGRGVVFRDSSQGH